MVRKIPHKLLNSLWTKQDDNEPRFIRGSRENILRKTIDNICMSADMSVTTNEYAMNLCEGMIYLFKSGFKPSDIISHNILLQKLLSLGKDIMDKSVQADDLFYVGAFIEVKMTRSWKDINFFKILKAILVKIKEKVGFFSKTLKNKIEQEFQLYFPSEYTKFFLIPLKSSA